jgi:hypothetical protein
LERILKSLITITFFGRISFAFLFFPNVPFRSPSWLAARTQNITNFFCAFQFQQNNTKDNKKQNYTNLSLFCFTLCNMHKTQFGYLQRMILDLLLEADLAKLKKKQFRSFT